jgi:hypothetical protein
MIVVALFGGFLLSLGGLRSDRKLATNLRYSPSALTAQQQAANPPYSQGFAAKGAARSHVPATGQRSAALPSDIIKTANLTIRVGQKNALHASQQATTIADGLGGYVAYRNSYNHNADIDLEIRVPAQSFDFALKEIRILGTVESESDNTQDVTLQVVDLGARLKNLEAQRNELLALYARAKSVADTIRVQNVLSNVQGQVEQTQTQMRYLANQTSLATISLSFETKPRHHHHPVVANRLVDAIGTAGTGIVNVIAGAIVVVGYALPLAALMLLGYAAYAAARRMYIWRRSTRPVGSAPSA